MTYLTNRLVWLLVVLAGSPVLSARAAVLVVEQEPAVRPAEVNTAAAVEAQVERVDPPGRAEDPPPKDFLTKDGALPSFAILTSGGPVTCRMVVLVDGRPYPAAREDLGRELLASFDTNADGRVEWKEAAASPRFLPGRFSFRFDERGLKTARLDHYASYFRRRYDTNGNGLLDAGELGEIIAFCYGAASFQMQANAMSGLRQVPERDLLDTNRDRILSAQEIREAGNRLASRDKNGNELVELGELALPNSASPMPAYLPLALPLAYSPESPLTTWIVQRRYLAAQRAVQEAARKLKEMKDKKEPPKAEMAPPPTAEEIAAKTYDPAASFWTDFHTALCEHYGRDGNLTPDHLPLVRGLAVRLDANSNGRIDADEVAALATMAPQLVLEARVVTGEKGSVSFALVSLDAELGTPQRVATSFGGTLNLNLRGAQLRFGATHRYHQPGVQATATVTRFDANKNGRIERTEMRASDDEPVWLFDQWDANRDGQVTAAEIAEIDEQRFTPPAIALGVTDQPYPLFHALDVTGDQRLSQRELRRASERLLDFDFDRDGEVTEAETPSAMNVHLLFTTEAKGAMTLRGQFGVFNGSGTGGEAAPSGPDWFIRMDRNGDGDVSRREFFGTREQFERLDADRDGFIDPGEAAAK